MPRHELPAIEDSAMGAPQPLPTSAVVGPRKTLTGCGLGACDAPVRERYADFGPTFAAEKLAERHDLKVPRETLRS
jgi:hypothetical protein